MNFLKLSLTLFAICLITGTVYVWWVVEDVPRGDNPRFKLQLQCDSGGHDILQVGVSYALERLERPDLDKHNQSDQYSWRAYKLTCNYKIQNTAEAPIQFTWPPLSMTCFRDSWTDILDQSAVESHFEMEEGGQREIALEPGEEILLGYLKEFQQVTTGGSEPSDEPRLNDWEVIGLNVWIDDAAQPRFVRIVCGPFESD